MKPCISCTLDVLTASLSEVNDIEVALQKPSDELVDWAALHQNGLSEPYAAVVAATTAFTPVENLELFDLSVANLALLDKSESKARRFSRVTDHEWHDLVLRHVLLVSAATPSALFLLENWNVRRGSTAKFVIRAGQKVRESHVQSDGDNEWTTPDIFEPYRSEYRRGLDFGSLWQRWISNLGRMVSEVSIDNPGTALEKSI